MRGIPPHGAGGYMRPGMAVPERQPSLHGEKPENSSAISIIRALPLRAALRIFAAAAALLLLSACAGREPHPLSSGPEIYESNAPFIVEKVRGAGAEAISAIRKEGIVSSFILSLSACVKDRLEKDAAIQEARFFIEYETNLPGARLQKAEALSDVNGCIQWEEEYKYKYTIQPVWLVLSRVVKREEGAYAGQSKIHLAVNPWLPAGSDLPSILDMRPQYEREHKIFNKYPYKEDGLKYLSQTDDFSEYPQLWAPALDLQFDIAPKFFQSKEGEEAKALLDRYRNICGRESGQEDCYRRLLKMNLTVPLKLRSYGADGQIWDHEVRGGNYKVKSRLIAISDVQDTEKREAWQIHDKECSAEVDLYGAGAVGQKTKYISLLCDLKISYFNNNAKYKMVLEIEPGPGLPFKKFQGVYTIALREGIRHGVTAKLIMDGEIDKKYQNLKKEIDVITDMNIKDIYALAESMEKGEPRERGGWFRGFLSSLPGSGPEADISAKRKSRFNSLGFRPAYLNLNLEKVTFSEVRNNEDCASNESAVKRRVQFIGKACLQDPLTDQRYPDTVFRVFIEKKKPGAPVLAAGEIEEAFHDRKKKTLYETDSNGCISWTDVVEHNIYDRQVYYIREMHFLSEERNLYGAAYVAISPWQRAFQAYQDINQLSVDEIRTSPKGIHKPRMIINQFRSVNFFPSYIIDRLLNLRIYHNLYFLFQPFIERHDNLALGRDHRARELIRDGYYITRILLIRNPQETGEISRLLSPDEAHSRRLEPMNKKADVQITGGEYLTHVDTVIKAKANFLNLYMPLHLTAEQIPYLASRNIISIQVVPADPSGFRFKEIEGEEAECELDLDRTVWRPYPDDKHELKTAPYAGAFNIQNWMNWNVLHPQESLDTDAIIDSSEIGRPYRHFCLSGQCGEQPLRGAAPPLRPGEDSGRCAAGLMDENMRELLRRDAEGGLSEGESGSLREKLEQNQNYDLTACAPDLSDEDLKSALTAAESGMAEASVSGSRSPHDEILAENARAIESGAANIFPNKGAAQIALKESALPPSSPIKGYLAEALSGTAASGEALLKGFAAKSALRLVELDGEEGERFIEDLGGFFEDLKEGRGLLTADILQALPYDEDSARLRAEISESCGSAIKRWLSDDYENCVHEILLAYMEGQARALKDLESEKWPRFFEEAGSLPEPWGAGFLEKIPDEGERGRLEGEIASSCGPDEGCAHNILASYLEEKARRFNDMEAYIERESRKAVAGGFFHALASLAGISGRFYGAAAEAAPMSPLLLEKPLKIYRQLAPYIMERPRMEALTEIIGEGINSQNSGRRDVLSFARSLCGFWFESYLRDYLQPEQMIAAYTDFVSKFDYYQVLESDWDQNDKSAFLEDFLDIVPKGEGEIRRCHKKYTRCILSDHCALRDFSKMKRHGYCRAAPKEEASCLKIREEECASAPHLSFCGEKSHQKCQAALNSFCHISPDHRACRRFASRCLSGYHSCIKSREGAAFFERALAEWPFDISSCSKLRHPGGAAALEERIASDEKGKFYMRKCARARSEPFKTCERNPFEFFKFENKMIVHELAKKTPQYVSGFSETISVTGSFSTGSYMNWTAQRSTSLNTSLTLPKIGISKSSTSNRFGDVRSKINTSLLKLDFFDIGGSIGKGISSNESNSGRRAIDVRVNKSAFLTTSRATFDIGAAKFQKCLVVKPRPNAFFAKLKDGLWEAYSKDIWSENFQEGDFRKVFVSRPGLMICSPPEQRDPEAAETIRESYYYTQALGDPTNSQLLNLYDLANRPFMSLIRGRKEFLKFFNMLKNSIEGDNGEAGQNAAINHPPSNMFINYPHPVEEAIGLSLSLRVFNETGFYPGVFNYADESDDLDADFIRKEQSWFQNLFEHMRNFNYFDLPPQPVNRLPVQERPLSQDQP